MATPWRGGDTASHKTAAEIGEIGMHQILRNSPCRDRRHGVHPNASIMPRARTAVMRASSDDDDSGGAPSSSLDHAMARARPGRVRGCTDVVPLAAFLCTIAAMAYIFIFSAARGDVERVLSGMDYMSDLCGHDNSAHAGVVVNATFGLPTIFDRIWPFGYHATVETRPVLRGGRDLRARPYLYYSMPTGIFDGRGAAALCVSECPGAATGLNESALAPPSEWLCTGEAYTRGAAPAGCDDEGDASAACVAHRASFFVRAPPAELAKCDDLAQDCDVCYPPYKTIGLLGRYCLPDPRNTLRTFETIAVAFGAVGVAIGGGGTGSTGAPSPPAVDGVPARASGPLTVDDLEHMRRYISSAPHLIYEDLALAWPLVCACIGSAFVFGLVWMLLLRVFAAWMVWGTVVSIAVGAAVGSWYMWTAQERMGTEPRYLTDELYRQQADFLKYGFFGLAGAGVLYCLAVVFLRRRIAIAVRVMREASKAVAALPLMLLLPLASLALGLCLLAYAAYAALLLISTGELQPGHAGFAHITVPASTWGWLALHALGALWLLWFVKHLQHCAVSGAVSQWYFAEDKWLDLGGFPVLGALCKAVRYHAGSVALGSLLITALMLVRFIVLSVLKRAAACAGDSRVAKLACCCIACCLGCVERSVRFLSRSAYVELMIGGRSFCASAFEALGLLTRNMLKVAVVRSIGAGFLLVGKLFIAAACAGVGAFLMLTQSPYREELASIAPATVAIALGAWVVGSAFMGVYNMTIDAIFICFCVDHEAHGKTGRPTYATASLKELIRDHEGEAKANGEKALPQEVSSTKNPWGEADVAVVEMHGGRRGRGARRVDGRV